MNCAADLRGDSFVTQCNKTALFLIKDGYDRMVPLCGQHVIAARRGTLEWFIKRTDADETPSI